MPRRPSPRRGWADHGVTDTTKTGARPPKRRRFVLTYRTGQVVAGYALVTPLLLWLGVTIAYPLFNAVELSLLDIRIIGQEGAFLGLDNYLRTLGSDRYWSALGRSGIWIIGNAVAQTLLAFMTALAINQRFPGVRLVRSWVILTWIVPTVVVVIIWRWLLGTSGGLINYLIMLLGFADRPIGFFGSGGSAMTSVILINSWRLFPFIAVILLAGLQRIPIELYEAATMDGANSVQKFRYITLPLLQQTLFVLGLVGTLLSFNVFDVVWLLTAGGPSGATTTVPVLIYETAFKSYRLSEAAAMSVITGLFLMAFAYVLIRFLAPKAEV